MKKIILLLLLVLVSVTASARKSYITLSNSSPIWITGDFPSDIDGFDYSKYNTSDHYWYTYDFSYGELLNVLSGYGYEVEFMSSPTTYNTTYLLSKEIPSNQTQIEGDVNHDSEVNIADVNRVISLILGMLRDNPKLLEQLGIEQPK